MEAYKEVTVWSDAGNSNHTYLLDGSKMLAVIPWGTGEPRYFKTPITFEKRGRQFVRLAVNPFKMQKPESRRQVTGSSGSVYWVDDAVGSCTCPGWQFRGKCRHLHSAK